MSKLEWAALHTIWPWLKELRSPVRSTLQLFAESELFSVPSFVSVSVVSSWLAWPSEAVGTVLG